MNYNYANDYLTLFRNLLKIFQKELEIAIQTKITIYESLKISKNYDRKNNAVYDANIRMNHLQSWALKVNPITSEVRYIDFIQYKE